MILLDTDVLIDCQRGLPAAGDWLSQSSNQEFAIPGIVAMELIVGCRNKDDLQRAQAFMRYFVIWPQASEIERAF